MAFLGEEHWTGQGLQQIVGYFSFACGFQRPLFSVLAETFAESTAYSPLVPFTPSDAAVLEILLSALLIPLAFTDLRASISRTISTSDALRAGRSRSRGYGLPCRMSPSGAGACGGACGGDERRVHPQTRDCQEYRVPLRTSGCARSWSTVPMELRGNLLLVILCLLAHAGLPVAAHS